MYSIQSKHCIVYIIQSTQCTVYSVQCTLYNLHIIQCIVHIVQSTQCTLYTVHCTTYNIQRTLYTVQCTVNSVYCTLYINMYCVYIAPIRGSFLRVRLNILFEWVCKPNVLYVVIVYTTRMSRNRMPISNNYRGELFRAMEQIPLVPYVQCVYS